MQTQIRRNPNSDTITTIKVSSEDLTLLSKLSAFLRSHFQVFSSSSVMVNQETQVYFMFLNIKNSEVAEKLQEITPYGAANP